MEPLAHLPKSTPGVDDLVEALMNSAGHINVLLLHMSHTHRAAGHPDADPPMIVLRGLLRGTLAQLADRFALTDLQTATKMVNRAMAIAEREIIFIPPDLCDDEDDR